MKLCVNCPVPAQYEYKLAKNHTVLYCNAHLPNFLKNQKSTGSLALTVDVPVEEAPKPKAIKKPKVEEVVVEEPVVDLAPEVVDEPATIEDDATN